MGPEQYHSQFFFKQWTSRELGDSNIDLLDNQLKIVTKENISFLTGWSQLGTSYLVMSSIQDRSTSSKTTSTNFTTKGKNTKKATSYHRKVSTVSLLHRRRTACCSFHYYYYFDYKIIYFSLIYSKNWYILNI